MEIISEGTLVSSGKQAARGRRAEPPFATIDEAFLLARRHIPRVLYRRVNAGSRHTFPENTRIFDDVLYRPRAACVFEEPDLRTSVLGTEISLPVLLSSPGGSRLHHPQGEKAVAAAAGRAGTIDIAAMGT